MESSAFVLAFFIRPQWLGLAPDRKQNELAKKLGISRATLN
jgi:DNA-binding transcriptional regulator LsrR (DeoR family)